MRVIMILGMMPRSGTNYLYQLIARHPACVTHPEVGEDYLLSESAFLARYMNAVKCHWTEDWQKHVDRTGGLMHYMGDALLRGLFAGIDASGDRVLLTKTPSVEGLENFASIFPGAKLLLVVRDGRDVIESGIRSFKWNPEKAIRWYARSARQVLTFRDNQTGNRDHFRVVRYEELYTGVRVRLQGILEFLGLDPDVYDFNGIETMDVVGSSDLAQRSGKVDWAPRPWDKDFNPLERWRNWSPRRRERFYALAGRYFEALGYDEDEQIKRASATRRSRWINRCADAKWLASEIPVYLRGKFSRGAPGTKTMTGS